jgi:hypothetical protein
MLSVSPHPGLLLLGAVATRGFAPGYPYHAPPGLREEMISAFGALRISKISAVERIGTDKETQRKKAMQNRSSTKPPVKSIGYFPQDVNHSSHFANNCSRINHMRMRACGACQKTGLTN